MEQTVCSVKNLKKYYNEGRSLFSFALPGQKVIRAVDDVSFNVTEGQTFALVGESGSGKTTTCRLIDGLVEPTSGEIEVCGRKLSSHDRELRRNIQMVFQDVYDSLNPRRTVEGLVGRPLEIYGIAKGSEKRRMVIELLKSVGLSPPEQFIDRFRHELSGGQAQRVGVARALALRPKVVIADEPVSALDVSVRSQILNLLEQLKGTFGLTYLLVTHDLSVVRYMSTWVAVMYLGKIVESASTDELFDFPMHPYTFALLASVPSHKPSKYPRIHLKDVTGSSMNLEIGCQFSTRCPYATTRCVEEEPTLREIRPNHLVACHNVESIEHKFPSISE